MEGICVSKSIGLACSGKEIYHFCFVLLCIRGQIPSTSPSEGLYSEGRFNGGFFALRFWELIFGGVYFRNLKSKRKITGETWSRGTNSRLPFGVNVNLNLSSAINPQSDTNKAIVRFNVTKEEIRSIDIAVHSSHWIRLEFEESTKPRIR